MKTIILRQIADSERQQALTAARDWEKWHDKPGHQKHKTELAKKFFVHETAAGSIVVKLKKVMAILLTLIVTTLMVGVPSSHTIAQSDAKNLWKIIEEKSGIKKTLTFIPITDPPGSYRITSDSIFFSDERNNPGSVYAVARLAEELFNAIMIRPGADGIIIQNNDGWKNLKISYTPTLVRSNLINRNTDVSSRLWLWWHHVPTKGSLDSTFWHQSWFVGLAIKYPQLAPPTGTITQHTKPNILHADFPKIIHQEWIARGRSDFCNLFELDGTDFWWLNHHYAAPDYLSLGEKERFKMCLNQSIKPNVHPGFIIRSKEDGKRYQLTDNFFTALQAIPNQNKYIKSPTHRCNYTNFYLHAFTKIRDYFDQQGDNHVTFNILAYSGYRSLPEGSFDLRRFHVYYTSPTANAWEWEEMIADSKEFVKWKTTGAKVIWRPNFILRLQERLIYNLVSTYIHITQPDGYQIPPYTSPMWPIGNGVDIYATMRAMQGKSFQDYFKYVPEGWLQWHNSMIIRGAQIPEKDEDDI